MKLIVCVYLVDFCKAQKFLQEGSIQKIKPPPEGMVLL